MLTSTQDIVWWCEEYIKDLLSPTDRLSAVDTVNEIFPEFLKALWPEDLVLDFHR